MTALTPINQKSGFSRRFTNEDLTKLNTAEVSGMVVGIAGATSHHIYFKTRNPAQLWVTDKNLQNGKYISLNIPNNQRIASAFLSVVDSPAVYIMAGNVPAVIQADINGGVTSAHSFPTAIFSRAVKISPTSYIFRGFDTTQRKSGQIFIKGGPQMGIQIRKKSIYSNVADPLGITSDGHLNYDTKTNLITIVSFYQNRVVSMDTNLNLVRVWNTIDTVTDYKVNISKVGGIVTNSTPQRLVNSKNRVADGRLYNYSRLQADNQEGEKFQSHASIDVYDIGEGRYLKSFYIPYYRREKIFDFKIIGDIIVVVYQSHVVSYQIQNLN